MVIKKSLIKDAGFGLFAGVSFNKHDAIGLFMGETYPLTQKNTSKYAISSPFHVVDAMGGINSGHPWYWGLHFANDPNYVTRGICCKVKTGNQSKINATILDNMVMYCTKNIQRGNEIYLDYRYK